MTKVELQKQSGNPRSHSHVGLNTLAVRIRPLRRMPEFHILTKGLGLSLAWEALQSPFYADSFEASWGMLAYSRIHCSVGDVMIMLVSFWFVALIWGRSWMSAVDWIALLMFLGVGIVYTGLSEYLNVYSLQNWSYSRWMPTIAGIGLVPLIQWVVVPLVVIRLARNHTESRGFKDQRPLVAPHGRGLT